MTKCETNCGEVSFEDEREGLFILKCPRVVQRFFKYQMVRMALKNVGIFIA